MKSLSELVNSLKLKGVLNDDKIEAAFSKVDRQYFVPKKLLRYCYEDRPLPIGSGQTISQPYTVAFMLELLDIKSGQKILDIGCGSGYTTGLIAYIIGSKGIVYAIDRLPELVELTKSNLSNFEYDNFKVLTVTSGIGIPGKKFDRILVSAAASVFPIKLLEQLNPGGKIVIPVMNSIMVYEKTLMREVVSHEHYGFSFVPLIID